MTPFTLRAFGAFYLALVVGAVWLVGAQTIGPILTYLVAGLGLVIPITAAIVPFAGVFEVERHPLQLIYIGAYVLVMVVTAAVVLAQRKVLPPTT